MEGVWRSARGGLLAGLVAGLVAFAAVVASAEDPYIESDGTRAITCDRRP